MFKMCITNLLSVVGNMWFRFGEKNNEAYNEKDYHHPANK